QHRLGRVYFAAGLPQQAENNYKSALSILMLQMDLSSSDLLSALLADYIDLCTKTPDKGKALSSKFQNELLKDRLDKLERTMGVGASIWNKEVTGTVSTKTNTGRIDASSTYTSNYASSTKSNFQKEEERIFLGTSTKSGTFGNSPASPSRSTLDALTLDKINRQRVDFYERMIAADIDSLGSSHPSVARDLCGLASIYLLQNNYDSAKPLLNRALGIYKNVYNSEALPVQRTESLLSYISEKQNPSQMETVASNDYASGLPAIPLSAQKLEIVLKLNYLAFLNYSHGKIQDAANLYAWALADTILSCGTDNGLLASCLSDYSRVLSSSGKSTEAQAMENSAQIILKKELAKEAALSFP
ncbi:MAG: tetratricopeptide repeat protein, partial [Candidatus Obscuribacterales bacterium]|nr:tetratricopeptide repeat protein [Candidatus Obscuribacterales bacterium]